MGHLDWIRRRPVAKSVRTNLNGSNYKGIIVFVPRLDEYSQFPSRRRTARLVQALPLARYLHSPG
eukprot:2151390-Pleurochrysis_carterae.AAC.1